MTMNETTYPVLYITDMKGAEYRIEGDDAGVYHIPRGTYTVPVRWEPAPPSTRVLLQGPHELPPRTRFKGSL